MKVHSIRTAMLAFAIGVAGVLQSASASVLTLDNYVINLGAVPGFAGFGTIGTVGGDGVDQIILTGIGHTHLGNELPGGGPNGFGVPDTGEMFAADILMRAVGFPSIPAGLTSTGRINEVHYEMTFSFSNAAVVGTVLPDGFGGFNASFAHLGGATLVDGFNYDGILEVFLDSTPEAHSNDTFSTGADGNAFTDGVLIATFAVQFGDGGVINTRTRNGSDDATFVLLSALPGVFLDNAGNDIGIPGLLVGLTDTNFDLDPDGNGLIDSFPIGWPAPDGGGFAFTSPGPGGPTFVGSAYFQEDGSADFGLGVVPEPMSIAVWAGVASLAGVVAYRRSRK